MSNEQLLIKVIETAVALWGYEHPVKEDFVGCIQALLQRLLKSNFITESGAVYIGYHYNP